MIMLEVLYFDGSHAWIVRDNYDKMENLNWDRYSWYQSKGLEVERVRDDEIVRLHVQTYDHS